jgi:hypothetical protein
VSPISYPLEVTTDGLSDGISDEIHLSFSAVIIAMYNIEKKSSLKDLTP